MSWYGTSPSLIFCYPALLLQNRSMAQAPGPPDPSMAFPLHPEEVLGAMGVHAAILKAANHRGEAHHLSQRRCAVRLNALEMKNDPFRGEKRLKNKRLAEKQWHTLVTDVYGILLCTRGLPTPLQDVTFEVRSPMPDQRMVQKRW